MAKTSDTTDIVFVFFSIIKSSENVFFKQKDKPTKVDLSFFTFK